MYHAYAVFGRYGDDTRCGIRGALAVELQGRARSPPSGKEVDDGCAAAARRVALGTEYVQVEARAVVQTFIALNVGVVFVRGPWQYCAQSLHPICGYNLCTGAVGLYLVGYGVALPVESFGRRYPFDVVVVELPHHPLEGAVQGGDIGVFGKFARGDDLAHEDLGFGVAGQNLGYDGALGRDYAVDGILVGEVVVACEQQHHIGRIACIETVDLRVEIFGRAAAVAAVGDAARTACEAVGADEVEGIARTVEHAPQRRGVALEPCAALCYRVAHGHDGGACGAGVCPVCPVRRGRCPHGGKKGDNRNRDADETSRARHA